MHSNEALRRCEDEQQVCGDYIRSGGPDQRGAMRGAEDWLMEEAMIRKAADRNPQYSHFLEKKAQLDSFDGFEPIWIPSFLFDFQTYLVDWAIRKGKGAIFADCGMGKTPIALTWAENIVRKTNRPVLNITPLGVAAQTIREGEKFGIDCRRSSDGSVPHKGIVVTNYERLSKFNPADFAGCICDESSILKNFDGVRRSEITEFMRRMQYRLLCTATAAPNDYIELGTSKIGRAHV